MNSQSEKKGIIMLTIEAYGPASLMMSSRLRFMLPMCVKRRKVTPRTGCTENRCSFSICLVSIVLFFFCSGRSQGSQTCVYVFGYCCECVLTFAAGYS